MICRLLLLFVLFAPSVQAEIILVLGDSLSAGYGLKPQEGWVRLLQERLGDEHQVVNISVSGETTSGGLQRLPDALSEWRADLVLLELGANDGLRGYPIERIRANLKSMLLQVRASGGRALLFGMQLPPNYGRRYAEAFGRMFLQLAEETGTPFVPFFLAGVATDPSLMQGDGLHPTAEAQPALLDAVYPTLEKLLSASRPR